MTTINHADEVERAARAVVAQFGATRSATLRSTASFARAVIARVRQILAGVDEVFVDPH